jgi:hypothetical protein
MHTTEFVRNRSQESCGEEWLIMRKIEKASTMNFVNLVELYPDEYILVKIVEIDYDKGKETGVALYVSETEDELFPIANKEDIDGKTIILPGENLHPMFGGLML